MINKKIKYIVYIIQFPLNDNFKICYEMKIFLCPIACPVSLNDPVSCLP